MSPLPLVARCLFQIEAKPIEGGTRFTVTPRWFVPQSFVKRFASAVLAQPGVKRMRVWGTGSSGEELEGVEVRP